MEMSVADLRIALLVEREARLLEREARLEAQGALSVEREARLEAQGALSVEREARVVERLVAQESSRRASVFLLLTRPKKLCSPVNMTISDLVAQIDACGFKECESLDTSYLRAADTSDNYITQSPRVSNASNGASVISMSKFRRGMTTQPFQLYTWNLDDASVRKLVIENLFDGNTQVLDAFLDSQSKILDSLRRLFFAGHADGNDSAESSLQAIFLLFTDSLVKLVRRDFAAELATESLSHEFSCRPHKTTGGRGRGRGRGQGRGRLGLGKAKGRSQSRVAASVLKMVTGKTDVFVVERGDADCAVSVLRSGMLCFHAELKAPYRGLHHQASAAEKDQLLCENEVMLQMSGKAVAGALTDLFALSTSLCVCVAPDFESCDDTRADADADEDEWVPAKDLKSAHFLAPRVTRARDYVLHLLLLLCGPDACATLLPPPEDCTPLEVPLQQQSQCPTRDEAGGAAAAPGPVVRRLGLRERGAPHSGSAMNGPQSQAGRQVSGGLFKLPNYKICSTKRRNMLAVD